MIRRQQPQQARDGDGFLGAATGPETVLRYFRRAHARRRLAHAYLFSGPPGSGRRQFALTLARALLCENGGPCGSCPSCHAALHGNHADLEIFSPDGRRAAMDIGDVRGLARKDHRRHDSPRIWIIEGCERLAPAASNALLKTLEEPGAGTLLILLAPSTGSLLPTLVSRCQRIQFPARAPSPSDVVADDGDDDLPVDGPEWLERLAVVLEPDFLAEHDPRQWLEGLAPTASSTHEALVTVLDGMISRSRATWKDLQRQGRDGGGVLLSGLESLLSLRRDLDGNVNADLILEEIILQLQSGDVTSVFD